MRCVTSTYDHALTVGFSRAFVVAAGIGLLALLIAIVTIRVSRQELAGAVPAPQEAAPQPAAPVSCSRSAPTSSTTQLAGDFRRQYPGFNQAPDPAALTGVASPLCPALLRLPWRTWLTRSRRCIKDAAARL
jgi:hypothetical protein